MRQALERRYRRILDGEGQLPDLLLIDGGRGQLGAAADVLDSLGVAGVTLLGGDQRQNGAGAGRDQRQPVSELELEQLAVEHELAQLIDIWDDPGEAAEVGTDSDDVNVVELEGPLDLYHN